MSERERYSCSECGHGRNLSAWAYGVFEGPLAANGLLDRYDYCEDTETAEASIRCSVHGDTVAIHKWNGESYCEWGRCDQCDGTGRVPSYQGSFLLTEKLCRDCSGAGGHWTPLVEAGAAPPKQEGPR